MNSLDVVTFGETMVAFNPLQILTIENNHTFIKQLAGSESNLAIGLSRMGHKVGWFSKLGNDSFGTYIRNTIRGYGVDTQLVEFSESHQTGILFKEKVTASKTNVIYYRKNSAASKMTDKLLDSSYFKNTKFLFITGITVSLSESCRKLVFTAIREAKKHGIKIVFDPNIRLKLWRDVEEATQILNDIVKQSDYILAGKSEGEFLSGKNTVEEMAEFLKSMNGNLKVIIKLGEDGCYYSDDFSTGYIEGVKVNKVVDPVGAGDGFATGFISGLLRGKSMEDSLKIANFIGAHMVQVEGDIEGFPSISQLEVLYSDYLNPEADEVIR